MNQNERIIREKRTIEANKKNIMGPAGKLGVIVRTLGSTIVRQGSGMYDENYLDDPYAEQIETNYEKTISGQDGPVAWKNEISEIDDDFIQNEGYVFDGLNNGIHLEIHYFHESHKIIVMYKGFEVYREVASELEAYAPFEEWEKIIEKLYKLAKKRQKEVNKVKEVEIEAQVNEEKRSFWQRMQMRWGL